MNSTRSGRPAARSGEEGYLLLLLLPVLLLGIAYFLSSVRAALVAQERNALQSRLDACAVNLAVGRETALQNIGRAGTVVADSAYAIYMERVFSVVLPMFAMSDRELVILNRGAAWLEDGVALAEKGRELTRLRCAPTAFSRETAGCLISPPLATALKRKEALFPDIRQRLVHRSSKEPLARVRCFGPHGLRTTLTVKGDANLGNTDFKDEYEH